MLTVTGLLASLLFSLVQVALERARSIQSLSNLRQIGIGMNLYANEHKDYFPVGYNIIGDKNWAEELFPYLHSNVGTDAENIFVSPNSVYELEPGPGSILITYSMHDMIAEVNNNDGALNPALARLALINPSDLILVADGVQNPTTKQSLATFWKPRVPVHGRAAFVNNLDDYVNMDDPAAQGVGSLSYPNNGKVNVLKVDGSVDSIEKGKVKFRNLIALP